MITTLLSLSIAALCLTLAFRRDFFRLCPASQSSLWTPQLALWHVLLFPLAALLFLAFAFFLITQQMNAEGLYALALDGCLAVGLAGLVLVLTRLVYGKERFASLWRGEKPLTSSRFWEDVRMGCKRGLLSAGFYSSLLCIAFFFYIRFAPSCPSFSRADLLSYPLFAFAALPFLTCFSLLRTFYLFGHVYFWLRQRFPPRLSFTVLLIVHLLLNKFLLLFLFHTWIQTSLYETRRSLFACLLSDMILIVALLASAFLFAFPYTCSS